MSKRPNSLLDNYPNQFWSPMTHGAAPWPEQGRMGFIRNSNPTPRKKSRHTNQSARESMSAQDALTERARALGVGKQVKWVLGDGFILDGFFNLGKNYEEARVTLDTKMTKNRNLAKYIQHRSPNPSSTLESKVNSVLNRYEMYAAASPHGDQMLDHFNENRRYYAQIAKESLIQRILAKYRPDLLSLKPEILYSKSFKKKVIDPLLNGRESNPWT